MAFIIFFAFAVATVVFSLMVVLARNPITSAVSLLGALLGVSGIFAVVNTGFLAVVQVLVYGGAVVTLFVFVVMLLNLSPEDLEALDITWQKFLGVLVAGLIMASISSALAILEFGPAPPIPPPTDATFSAERLGEVLFLRYLVPFEMTSILLLSAIAGVIALGRKGAP